MDSQGFQLIMKAPIFFILLEITFRSKVIGISILIDIQDVTKEIKFLKMNEKRNSIRPWYWILEIF